MLDATSMSIIVVKVWTIIGGEKGIPYPVRGAESIQTRVHRLRLALQHSPRHGGLRAWWLRPAAAPHL